MIKTNKNIKKNGKISNNVYIKIILLQKTIYL